MNSPAWGKTDGPDGSSHHLAHHSMDVAAVFQRLLALPVFRDRAEKAMGNGLSRPTIARLAALVFLHDIGKLHPGFQAKGWPPGRWRQPLRGHVAESLEFLELAWRTPDHPFHDMTQVISRWGEGVAPLIAASFSHHGRPITQTTSASRQDWPILPTYDWRLESTKMHEALRRWFPDAFTDNEALPDRSRFVHFFAGLAALADWVGSYRSFFHFSPDFDLHYDREAHGRAARVLAEIGLDVAHLPRGSSASFAQLTGFERPNPAQTVTNQIGSDEQLVILESETGSGKTEAALWRFARLFSDGCVDGLYFAVPTRAAARQLHGRVDAAMKRLFGSRAPETVLAIPGMLKAGEASGRRLPEWKVLWNDNTESVPARWAAEHATRFLAAAVAVGTVDQAMLAGLMVKHAHLRGSSLSRSLLVIDEVHASDAYMTSVLAHLLNAHLAIGGYAVLMSATLGSRARIRWTGEAQPNFKQAAATDYPAIWAGGDPTPRRAPGDARSKTVRVVLDDMAPQRSADLALEAARKGARVLVIRNTVTSAVETWRAAQDRNGAAELLQVACMPALHHGRFAAEDRELLDRSVEAVLTTQPTRPPLGVVVIGTQTLEQSLDIDADLLITDLCPMDVLLQRIGRLHRHALARPEGFEEAKTIVMAPEGGLDRLTEPAFENGLGGWVDRGGGFQGIYRDLAVLELTRRSIEKHPHWRIPEMNRSLVEGATHPECIASLVDEKGDAWKKYDRTLGGVIAAEGLFAQLQRLDRGEHYAKPFPNSDERIMTRLGEEGVILTLDPPPRGPFGQKITRIALPARWSAGISSNDAEAVEALPAPDGLTFTVGERQFTYSRTGLDVVRIEPTKGKNRQ